VPALGGELHVADHDVGVAVRVTPDAVEAGAAAVVGGVDAGAGVHTVSCGVRRGISSTSEHSVAVGEQALGGRIENLVGEGSDGARAG
jgi:hypothetical protein